MNKPRKLKRARERHYSAHHSLLHIATLNVDRAEKKQPGWSNDTFVALTFAALAVEAMANAIGDRVVPNWEDFESSSPTAKIRLIAERLGIECDWEAQPWKTVKWLAKLRNRIAHPKPEHIVDADEIAERDSEDPLADRPESKLERDITVLNARRAVTAVKDLKWLLCEKIPAEQRFGLSVDGWGGSLSASNEE